MAVDPVSMAAGIGKVVSGIAGAVGRRRDRKAMLRFVKRVIAARRKALEMQRKLTKETYRNAETQMFGLMKANVAGLPGLLGPSLAMGTASALAARQVYRNTGMDLKQFAREKAAALAETYSSTEYDGIDPKYFGGRAKEYKEFGKAASDLGTTVVKGMTS
ncbi:hypothetical protein [Limnobacter sp.]|uniref:hypothetical protein n=1 Tax=Limnobacter sp. TaxID=2003368 RepID=UPI0025B9AA3A|nr:hypothetical protein [Limnobacter sp.]